MQKIRITTNSYIARPRALENIDVRFGISYYSHNQAEITTEDNRNSWCLKILEKLDRVIKFVNKKENEDSEAMKQIMEDSNFIYEFQEGTTKHFQIQINSNTKISRALSRFKFKEEPKSMSVKAAYVRTYQKNIFLGLDVFKKGDILYDVLIDNNERKDIISQVFFHEYAHSAEIENYQQYSDNKYTNEYQQLIGSVRLLTVDTNFEKLYQYLLTEKMIEDIPSKELIEKINVLSSEMYADVCSILMMRNKILIEKKIPLETIETFCLNMIEARKKENHEIMTLVKMSYDTNHILLKGTHFTSPALEALSDYFQKIKDTSEEYKILPKEQMHYTTQQYVEIGMIKVVLAMVSADKQLIPQFKTLFSMTHNKATTKDDKDYYEESLDKMKKMLPDQWYIQSQKRMENFQKLYELLPYTRHNYTYEEMIMSAALDVQYFENAIHKLESYPMMLERLKNKEPHTNTINMNVLDPLNIEEINVVEQIIKCPNMDEVLFEINVEDIEKKKKEINVVEQIIKTPNMDEVLFEINVEDIEKKKKEIVHNIIALKIKSYSVKKMKK